MLNYVDARPSLNPPSFFSCFSSRSDYDSKYDIYQFYSGGITDSATEHPYDSYSTSACD